MTALFDQISVRYVTNLIRDFGLRPHQAAGFPGNFGVESDGFTDVTEDAPLRGRGGLGHAQNTGTRRVEFEAWLARRAQMGLSSAPDDFEANYSYLFRELEGGEGRRVLPQLRQAATVEQATEIVMVEFERPALATANLPRRIDYARQALAAFTATGIDPAALIAQGRAGAARNGEILSPLPADSQNDALLGDLIGVFIKHKRLDILTRLLPLFSGGQVALPPPDTVQPLKSDPVVPPKTPPQMSISMLLSLLLGAGTATGISTGGLGTPFELGQEPTTPGSLMTIASIVSPLLSYFGGYRALASGALSLLSGLAKRVPQK